jgi:hypothetical protein
MGLMQRTARAPLVIGLWVVLAGLLAWSVVTAGGASGVLSAVALAVLVVGTWLAWRRQPGNVDRAAGAGVIGVGLVLVIALVISMVLVLATWSGP